MKLRLVVSVALFVLLAFAAPLVWTLLGWPPPRLVLKYGIPPYCAPTGKTTEVEGIEFVEIGPGCFRMGSHYKCEKGDLLGRASAIVGLDWGTPPKHESDECPVHWVEFEHGYWIATTEITNEQYERFASDHERSGYSPGDRHPVVNVSFWDARAFCAWLAEKAGLQIRLPSEAEWECACRAGGRTEFCFGDEKDRLGQFAWFWSNSGDRAHRIGTRKANRWGLHDMHGNVAEWCEDLSPTSHRYAPESAVGVEGPWGRPIRGGTFDSPFFFCRSAYRGRFGPKGRSDYLGFRPCFWPPDVE